MSNISKSVSIHPYFKINEGRLEDFKANIKDFIERTQTEDKCFYYDFSYCAEENSAFCRESYEGAEGVLTHLENVGGQIEKALTMSDMYCLEIHGPSEEIAKLREPLAHLPVKFYEQIGGAKF
ncbi:MAG: putative quinol monooxygenase [Akkermansiaceae bacterium]